MYTLHSTVALAPKLSHRSQTDIICVWSWTTTEKSSENSKTKKKTAKMGTKLQTEDSKHEPLALGHDAPGAARRCQRLGTPTT